MTARAPRTLAAIASTALVIVLALAACGASRGTALAIPAIARLPISTGSHVIVIVMENKEASDVLGNPAAPYINALARRYALASASFAITHPSLPNYLALTSGSTHGISSDCTDCSVRAVNIVDQLARAGVSWKAYLENTPRPCFTGADAGSYAKKHDPFIYYDDVVRSTTRCSRLVGFGALAADLRAGRLPTYAWITPNLCDDMHDCSVATGDAFLSRTVPPLLHELGPHGFLILTWDEGTSNAGCCAGAAAGGQVATIVAGPDVIAGGRERAPVDHYGVLATVERALGLAPLGGAADARNGSLAPLFRRAPRIR